MNLTILIADDLEEDRRQLIDDLTAAAAVRQGLHLRIRDYSSGEQLLREYAPGSAQLAFLDICMDEISGIELGHALRELDKKLLIVFFTSSREYAFDAFPLHAFDYLLKPCSRETVSRVLDEVVQTLSEKETEIEIRAAHSTYRVPLSQIISIHSFGHYLDIYTAGGNRVRSIMTFAEIRELLKVDARFLECHRGILINMDHVLTLGEDQFFMDEGPACALRIRDRSKLIRQFSQYQISRMKGERPR